MTRLTDAAIRAATHDLWDGELKGFGLRVNKGGSKSFVVLLGSGKRRVVGRYPLISLQEARSDAKRLLAAHTLSPSLKPRTAHSVALDRYFTHCGEKNRPATLKEYRRYLTTIRFPHYLDDISARKLLDQIDGQQSRHHAFTAVRAYLKWCVSQYYLDRNPLEGARTPPTARPRERVLSDQELGEIYRTALQGTDSFSRLIQFLCLTAQRRGESSLIEHTWYNEATLTFPSHVTKNKKTHSIPITPAQRQVLGAHEGYAFLGRSNAPIAGWSKLKRKFDAKHSVTNYTLHDIRRSIATKLIENNYCDIPTLQKLLNHVSGAGVTGIYMRHNFLSEMRQALNAWAEHLSLLVEVQERKHASGSPTE